MGDNPVGMIVIEQWRTADYVTPAMDWIADRVGAFGPFVGTKQAVPCPVCTRLDGLRFVRGEGPQAPVHPACRCRRDPVEVIDPDTLTADQLAGLNAELRSAMDTATSAGAFWRDQPPAFRPIARVPRRHTRP